jgi:putative PEP-CTERM system TPR-repeat lipoprotein
LSFKLFEKLMVRHVFIPKIFLFLFLITFQQVALGNDKNVLEQANIAFKDNRHNEALIHLKNLTQNEPNNLAARLLMAEVLIAFGKGATAEVELNLAENLGADKNRTFLLFAEAYLLQGKYHDTINHLDKQVQDEILAAKIFVLRGHAQLGLRQLTLSAENYQQALLLNAANTDAKLGLAQVALNYYRYDEAQTYVDDVLSGFFPPVNAWILKASIHQNIAELDIAFKAINNALLENPNHIQALILRASLYIEFIEYESAKKDILTVLQLVPNEPKAMFLSAMIETREDENSNVREKLSKLSESLSTLDNDTLDNNPSYYYLASVVAFQQNNYEAADQYIKNYLNIDRFNIKAMTFSATIHIAMKNYTAALSVLNKANLQKENNPKVISLLGLVSSELKQYEKAKFYFQKVIELLPDSSIASQQLAKNSIDMGAYQQAIDTLLSINASSEYQSTISFLLVQAYVKSGQMTKAVALAEKLVKAQPDNKEFLHHLGFIYQIVGDYNKAKQAFEHALSIDALHIKSLISLAETLLATGKIKASFELLEQALLKQENNKELISALGKNYTQTRQFKESIVWFKRAYNIEPNNKDLLKQLSFSYMAAGEPVEAIEIIESYLSNHEKTADLFVLLGNYYQQQNNFDKALQSFNNAIKFDGDKGKVYFYIAQFYQANNKPDDALEAYKKSIAWSENKQIPLVAASQFLNQQKKPLEAIKLANDFLESYSTKLQMILAHSYYLSGQYDNAEKSYKKTLALTPPQDEYHDNIVVGLSLVYQAQKRNSKATQLLTKYLNKEPMNFLMNSSLAEIYMINEQWKKAYDIYILLLTKYAQQAVLHNNAAFAALNLALYDEAEKHSLASLAITKNHPDSLDTLGWIYYHTQEFDKALPLFRQALALDYSKIEIKYHLALTLKALNREKEAFNTLLEVVNSKRDFPEKNEAHQWLKLWAEALRTNNDI